MIWKWIYQYFPGKGGVLHDWMMAKQLLTILPHPVFFIGSTLTSTQELLFKAINHEDFQSELEFVSHFYGDDVNKDNLKSQLQMISLDFPNGSKPPNVFTILAYMKTLCSAKKQLLSDVCTILKLVLVMPATNASSERSFSALRRVKSYLRSTMRQDRLNHLMVLHIHDERTDELDLKEVVNEFVGDCEHRLRTFGKF